MKTINNKAYNKTVSTKSVSEFAYKYIPAVIAGFRTVYNLPSAINLSDYKSEVYLQLTTYNTKQSTDLMFKINADFYKGVVTVQLIDSYTETASYLEISFNEIETVKESNELANYINNYIKLALENANKVVAEYKKKYNLK